MKSLHPHVRSVLRQISSNTTQWIEIYRQIKFIPFLWTTRYIYIYMGLLGLWHTPMTRLINILTMAIHTRIIAIVFRTLYSIDSCGVSSLARTAASSLKSNLFVESVVAMFLSCNGKQTMWHVHNYLEICSC